MSEDIKEYFNECIDFLDNDEKNAIKRMLNKFINSKFKKLNKIKRKFENNNSQSTNTIVKKIKISKPNIDDTNFVNEDIVKINKERIKEYFNETGKQSSKSHTLNFCVFIYFNTRIIEKYRNNNNENIRTTASRLYRKYKNYIIEDEKQEEELVETSQEMENINDNELNEIKKRQELFKQKLNESWKLFNPTKINNCNPVNKMSSFEKGFE